MASSLHRSKNTKSFFYQIMIEGEIHEDWSNWMNGMELSVPNGGDASQITVLTGTLIDQAALRGLLCRLWDLNLNIISIFRLEMNAGVKEGER